jgi:hydrogenase/urease accessory protein HupE
MSHSSAGDYARRAKQGVVLGFCLFAAGAVGEFVGHSYLNNLPGWEQALLFDSMVLGILVALLSLLVFGVVLPLTQ